MLFELLESQHVGPDYSQDPVELKDEVTGKVTKKYPSKTYNKGDVIDSGDYDLAAKLGASKFRLIETGRKGKRKGEQPQTIPVLPSMVAPHGQVSQGHQVATTNSEGLPSSRAMTAEESEEAGLTQPPTSFTKANLGKQSTAGSSQETSSGDAGDESTGKQSKQKLSEQYALEEMTKAELKDLADQEDVDITGCNTKDDILKVMKKH